MSLKIRGKSDKDLRRVKGILEEYQSQHPGAGIEIYRQNSVSIRIRMVDTDFANISRTVRHESVWRMLDELPEEIQSQLTMILLLIPEEKNGSFANVEFDDPIPSKL